jgi:hypothetical protein
MSEIQQLPSKFGTCKHRSEEEVSQTIKRCSCQGGSYEVKGYYCNKKNIIKLEPDICIHCEEYESK